MIEKIISTRYVNENDFEFSFEPIESSISIVKTKQGYISKYVSRDEIAESPREWNNFGNMYCYHRNYDLGDKLDIPKFDTIQELQDYLIKEKKAVVMLPLYILDHSGITMRAGRNFSDVAPQGWDTSFVGYVYATKEDLKRKDISKKKAERILMSEVKTYDDYLTGEVYCIVKETYNKKKEPIAQDNIGGYFGYEYALESLKTDL
jgi:hypothetical protein